MSSKRMLRSISLDSGVTPRRLNHVVLPDPGKPIVSTTYPRGLFAAASSGGGTPSDSGCVSTTTLPSGKAVTSESGRYRPMWSHDLRLVRNLRTIGKDAAEITVQPRLAELGLRVMILSRSASK